MQINKSYWGNFQDKEIYLFTITNGNIEVGITNYGATITSIWIADSKGKSNIVLGYDTLAEYLDDQFYMGCTIGRYAGRIAKGFFEIDNVAYQLAPNEGKTGNHLHGGVNGFNKKTFDIVYIFSNDDVASVELFYRSIHLEEGYPGNLDLWVTFELTKSNELKIRYRAKTDQSTHVNFTNHSYFNLSGGVRPATDSELFINADSYVVTDKHYIPTGEIRNVIGTSYDFTKAVKIDHRPAPLYNEYFILNKNTSTIVADAVLCDPVSGRKMTVYTTMPGLLLYTGDFLSGTFKKRQGVCLETQFFPDSPNHPYFPGTLLLPADEFKQETTFTFSN